GIRDRNVTGVQTCALPIFQAVPQPSEGISVAPKLDPGAAQVNWASPAPVVDRRIRGCTPAPGAWTTREGQRFKIGPVQPRPEAQIGRASCRERASTWMHAK